MDQATRTRVLTQLIHEKLQTSVGPWYSGGSYMKDLPRVTVLDEQERLGRVTVHFVADHYEYNYAQSGSDWADYYVFVGEAVFEGATLVRQELTPKHVHLTEREADEFWTSAYLKQVLADATAALKKTV